MDPMDIYIYIHLGHLGTMYKVIHMGMGFAMTGLVVPVGPLGDFQGLWLYRTSMK